MPRPAPQSTSLLLVDAVPWAGYTGPAGWVPSYRKFREGVARGTSRATSTEELPLSLVARMCGTAWLAQWWLLGSVGSCDWKVLEVQHLCQVKRLPRWCLKNSKPILLEPYTFKLESGLVFQRMQFTTGATGWNVFFSFACRAALSPVLCELSCRWLLAF